MKGFRDLEVWTGGMELAEAIYRITDAFPNSERFGLSTQLRRAAVSIVSNIAEGCGRRSTRDFRRFLDIAYGSLSELETQLLLSARLDLLSAERLRDVLDLTARQGRLLNGLRRSLLEATHEHPTPSRRP